MLLLPLPLPLPLRLLLLLMLLLPLIFSEDLCLKGFTDWNVSNQDESSSHVLWTRDA